MSVPVTWTETISRFRMTAEDRAAPNNPISFPLLSINRLVMVRPLPSKIAEKLLEESPIGTHPAPLFQ